MQQHWQSHTVHRQRGIGTRHQSNEKPTSVYSGHNISTQHMPAEHWSSEAACQKIRRCIDDDVIPYVMLSTSVQSSVCPSEVYTARTRRCNAQACTVQVLWTHAATMKNQSNKCATGFEQDKNGHIKCCPTEHRRLTGHKHTESGAVTQSTDTTSTATCSEA